MSALKRKHITLSIEEKNQLIQRLDRGEKQTKLADEYGIGRATIYNIIKNREKIETFISTMDMTPNKRQTLKKAKHPEVEEALYAWFLEEKKRHTPITGALLISKAKYLYNQLTNKNDFIASKGWLDRFKIRYGIKLMCLSDEKLNENSDEKYKETFQNFKITSEVVYGNDSNNHPKEEPIDHSPKESDVKDMVFSLSPFLSIAIDDSNFQNECETPKIKYEFDENSSQNHDESNVSNQEKKSQLSFHSGLLNDDIKCTERSNKSTISSKIATKDAINCFDICLKWAEENNYPCLDILLLKKMRNKALSHLHNSKRKKSDYFN